MTPRFGLRRLVDIVPTQHRHIAYVFAIAITNKINHNCIAFVFILDAGGVLIITASVRRRLFRNNPALVVVRERGAFPGLGLAVIFKLCIDTTLGIIRQFPTSIAWVRNHAGLARDPVPMLVVGVDRTDRIRIRHAAPTVVKLLLDPAPGIVFIRKAIAQEWRIAPLLTSNIAALLILLHVSMRIVFVPNATRGFAVTPFLNGRWLVAMRASTPAIALLVRRAASRHEKQGNGDRDQTKNILHLFLRWIGPALDRRLSPEKPRQL